MFSQDLVPVPTELVPTEGRLPAILEGSGRKARDRIEHFLRAAIDNDNTRKAYGRSLGSFIAKRRGPRCRLWVLAVRKRGRAAAQ